MARLTQFAARWNTPARKASNWRVNVVVCCAMREDETAGGNSGDDERDLRRGFEAAAIHKNRDRSYEQCDQELGDCYPRRMKADPSSEDSSAARNI